MPIIKVGDRVEYRTQNSKDHKYDGEPAEVIAIHGNKTTVRFEDGHEVKTFDSRLAWLPSLEEMDHQKASLRRIRMADIESGLFDVHGHPKSPGRPKQIASQMPRRGKSVGAH